MYIASSSFYVCVCRHICTSLKLWVQVYEYMSQTCLCNTLLPDSTSHYGRHSNVVQHNNNFVTVHRQDLMPSNASMLVLHSAHVDLPGRNGLLGDTVAKVCSSSRNSTEPVCVNKVRSGLASADQGFSAASQGSCHLHGTPC